MQRLLIVNADDYGMTREISRAVLVAHREGIVTSTSVLANGPAFAETARWLDEAPELGVGVHLAAVGGDRPLLSAREIPTLCDRDGRLLRSWHQLLWRRVDPDDLSRELSAQIEHVQKLGRSITHLDSHQHVHLWPRVGDVVIALAQKFGIPAIRVPRSRGRRLTGAAVYALSRNLARKAAAAGLGYTDAFAGFDELGRLEWPRLEQTIRVLGRSRGSAELCVHPGLGDAVCAPAAREAIELAGLELGTYADL